MSTFLHKELITWLDSIEITSKNIGEIRRKAMVPWDSEWNAFVRDETATRENTFDLWKSEMVKEALKERKADDIAILVCPECGLRGYYNQGSHFSCRNCEKTFLVLSDEEEAPEGSAVVRTTDVVTLADTITGEDGP